VWKSGSLPVDIPAIVSNHRTFEALAASYGIPFHHLPLAGGSSAETKRAQEQQVEALIEPSASTSSCWRATCRS
jgi:formyltetrahydrofolate deformylase